jgi:Sensors of blue-light using FAD
MRPRRPDGRSPRTVDDFRTMLIRLIYMSKAVGPQTDSLTDAILSKAHAWNTENDITGVLCQGQGVYLQVLEGERGKVTRLYARIFADPRHTDLELLHCEAITERRYGAWSMARVSLSDVDPQTKIVWPDFDPYSPNGAMVMARIDELVARGRLVHTALT